MWTTLYFLMYYVLLQLWPTELADFISEPANIGLLIVSGASCIIADLTGAIHKVEDEVRRTRYSNK